MKTPLCHTLGIEHPIIAAPMGPDLSGPELVAAVSNAGGLGILQAQFCPPPLFRDEIRRVRALTDRPFGVNLILHFPVADHVAICLDERVPVLSLFWGDPTPYVADAHAAGVKVFHQVGSVREAHRASAAGVDVVVAQGVEAGGHVAGEVSTLALVPRVVDAVAPRPVVAAGGIADARGVVAVLALGAQAAMLGTRFLASAESRAHPRYKTRLLEADEEGTVRTILFGHGWPNAPHRTLRTPFVQQWLGQEARGQQSRDDEPVVGQTVIGGQPMPVLRFMGFPPNRQASGDIDSMDLLAGQGVGLVIEIKPAGQIVRELVADARHIIAQRLPGVDEPIDRPSRPQELSERPQAPSRTRPSSALAFSRDQKSASGLEPAIGGTHESETTTTASRHRHARAGADAEGVRARPEGAPHHRGNRWRHLGAHGMAQAG